MSQHNFDEILNACLDLIQQGASVNDCLKKYPEAQAELRPILELTAQMSMIQVEGASIPAFRKGRNRLKAAVQAKQAKKSNIGWLGTFSTDQIRHQLSTIFRRNEPHRTRLMPVLVASVLLAFSFLFSVNASADSLPGDVLYPVKTFSQQTRIRLAAPDNRSAVVAEITAKRVADLDAIVNDPRRDATITLDGPITKINDDIIMVEGFEIWLTAETCLLYTSPSPRDS